MALGALTAVIPAAVCVSTATAGSNIYPTPYYLVFAKLTTAQEVSPPKRAAGASGSFQGRLTMDHGTATLTWQLRLSGLSGSVRGVRMHLGAARKTGPSAISLCPPRACRSVMRGTITWQTDARPSLVPALLHGLAYVNVYTALNSQGEIRGQLEAGAPAAAGG
jgi:hypothetical protein